MNMIIRWRSLRSRIRDDKMIDLQSWRNWLVDMMIIFGLFAFPLSMVVTIPIFIAERLYGLIAFDVAIWLVLIIRFFTMGSSYKERGYSWLTFLHIIAITFIIALGPHYARSGWLVMCAVMASLLFGARAAVFSTGINAAMLVMLYWLMGPENPPWVAEYAAPFGKWMMFVVNISIISLVSSLPVGLLLRRLDRSLGHERNAHNIILQEREELETTYRTLEAESVERKQAEDALRESEKKYRLIAENMADVISVLDMNLHFTYVSPSIMRIRGLTVEEAMEQTLDQVMTPESLKIALTAFEEEMKLEASGTADPDRIRTMELEENRKDGSIIWVEASLSYLRDKDHKPVAILAAIRDITKRKRAEEELRKSEEKYRFITDRINDVIWILDTNLRPTYVSPSILRVLGFTPEERLRQTLPERVTPASAEKVQEILKHELQRDRERGVDPDRALTFELEYYHKDGSTVWMEQVVGFIRDGEGNIVGIHGASRNITERKRVEESLLTEKQRFQTLSENAPLGMVLIEQDGTFRYINSKFRELFGYELTDVPDGKTWFRKAYADSTYRHQVISDWIRDLESAQQGEKRPRIFTVRCKDGTEKIINFIPVQLETGENLMACEDITEHRKAEEEKERLFEQVRTGREELRNLSRRLVEVQENERRDIARELHDQVGQNLTALGINLNIISSQLPAKSAGKVRLRLEDSLRLLEEIAERIRDVMADLRPPLLDDYGLAAALRWYGQRFLERTGVATVVQGEEMKTRLSPTVEAALFKIAQEALTNVARHSQAKQVIITLEEVSEGARLSIADDGTGFDLTAHHRPGARPEWGLMIIRERTEAVGGHLSLESTIGKGTQVVVEVARKN